MRDFRKLKIWAKAHQLVLSVYCATTGFPRTEVFGLTRQLRRAAASIPTNIAEGCGRDSEADFGRFLHMAMGSASEVEYHLLLAHDLKFLDRTAHAQLEKEIIETKRMLATLIQRVKGS